MERSVNLLLGLGSIQCRRITGATKREGLCSWQGGQNQKKQHGTGVLLFWQLGRQGTMEGAYEVNDVSSGYS